MPGLTSAGGGALGGRGGGRDDAPAVRVGVVRHGCLSLLELPEEYRYSNELVPDRNRQCPQGPLLLRAAAVRPFWAHVKRA